MKSKVLVDTGAVVGIINERDQNFTAAVPLFRELPKPFYTCEAVITEALFLARRSATGQHGLFTLLAKGVIKVEFALAEELEAVISLMRKYESVPMSLADACLVRMSELYSSSIFTFDGDFRIYRRSRNRKIALLGLDRCDV